MVKQLSVRNDEAYRLAHKIAEETKTPVVHVIVAALRSYGATLRRRDGMTSAQRAERDALRALARRASKHKVPGATSDHSGMYDEFGLPK